MPKYECQMDVEQAFNFKKDVQAPVGFITTLEVGKEKLANDLETLRQPTKPTETMKAVAVLESFSWETGTAQPMNLVGRVSTANKQKLATLLLNELINISVKFQYVIYQYDSLEKKYFKSSEHGKILEGLIVVDGKDVKLTLDNAPSTDVIAPQNYKFDITIRPEDKEQEVTLATADTLKVQKKWGTTVKPGGKS